VAPILTLEAHSEGVERMLTSSFELPPEDAGFVDASGAIHFVADVRMAAHSEVHFLGEIVAVGERKRLFCGFEFRPHANSVAGHMACADSAEDLVIPAADVDAPHTETLKMNAHHFQTEQHRKNVTLGGMMAMCLTLSLILLTCGLVSGNTRRRRLLSGLGRPEDGPNIDASAAKKKREVDVQDPHCNERHEGQSLKLDLGTIAV